MVPWRRPSCGSRRPAPRPPSTPRRRHSRPLPVLPATGVEVVRLDVVVSEKGRRPRLGLRREDFVVLEDGKPQPIVQFQAFGRSEAASRVGTAAAAPAKAEAGRSREGGRQAAGPLRRARDRRRAHGVREPRARAQGPRALPGRGPAARGPGGSRHDERRLGPVAGVHLRPGGPAADALAALRPGPARRVDRRPPHHRLPGGDDRGRGPAGPRGGDPGDPAVRRPPGRGLGRAGGDGARRAPSSRKPSTARGSRCRRSRASAAASRDSRAARRCFSSRTASSRASRPAAARASTSGASPTRASGPAWSSMRSTPEVWSGCRGRCAPRPRG